MKSNVDYNHILKLIRQLPDNEVEKLTIALQSEILSKKKSSASIQNIILEAPTWSDSDFSEYQRARDHINRSRIA